MCDAHLQRICLRSMNVIWLLQNIPFFYFDRFVTNNSFKYGEHTNHFALSIQKIINSILKIVLNSL